MPTIDELLTPPTPTAAAALEAAREWLDADLVAHSLRSWAWAADLGDRIGLAFDAELLFVAAMLHDAGVAPHFDAHRTPFEEAGGAVAAVFATGAGWDAHRRRRVAEVIERHAWPAVDPHFDAEGHLLEVATTLDVRGGGAERWDAAFLREVTEAVPRGRFSADFGEAMAAQASRKPGTNAARTHASGGIAEGARFWAELLG